MDRQTELAALKAELVEQIAIRDGKKLSLNGSFGKLGSRWSSLYSPSLLIQVTVTGQLALLMLIEALELAGIPVVSANTDGIVMLCPKRLRSEQARIIAEWERRTGLKTEETLYRALYSRDINNYVAVKPDGKAKTKGAYAAAGLMKNPSTTICADAVVKFLVDGTPVEETILRCTDVTKFTALRKVKGGAVWKGQYLGKIVRWVYVRNDGAPIEYASNQNKVARTDGCRPLMDLPTTLPSDLDYAWYVNEAYEILMDVGRFVRPPKLSAKRRKELELETKNG